MEGEIVAVPVPGLLNEIYISTGRAHGVREGDYFLAHNPNIRAVAVLKVTAPQERMSVVVPYALFASLRKGDRVTRISPKIALALKRQGETIGDLSPPLSSTVLVERDLQAIADSLGAPSVPPPVLAPPPAGPDMTGVILMARAAPAGITLSWNPPPGGTQVSGYVIHRATLADRLGDPIARAAFPTVSSVDPRPREGITYVYRLVAVAPSGAEAAIAPSVQAVFTAEKKGTFGIGGKPSAVAAKNVPAFPNPGAAGTAVLPAPPAPVIAASAVGTAVSALPRPAAPPAPVPPAPVAPAAKAPVPVTAAPIPPVPVSSAPVPAAPVPAAPVPAAPVPAAPVPAAPVPAAPVPPAPLPAAPEPATPAPTAPVPAPVTPPPAPPSPPKPEAAPVAPVPEAEALPPTPEKVGASLEGSTVVVKWNPVASKAPLAGYLVYRAYPGDEQGAAVNSAPVTGTFHKDRSAQEGRTYVYWVVAQTVEGRISAPSAKVKVDVPRSGGVVPFF